MGSAIHGSVTQNKVALLRAGGAKGSGAAGSEICSHEGAVAVAVDRELLAGQSRFLGDGSFAGARSLLRSGGEMEEYASQDRSRRFDDRLMRLRQFCLSAFRDGWTHHGPALVHQPARLAWRPRLEVTGGR
jgi:hypothetical protein